MLSILATNSIFERTAAKAAIGKLTTRLRWSTLDCRIWTNVRLDILIICNNYWSQRCCNIFDASSLLHITFQASRTAVLAYLRKVRFGYENGHNNLTITAARSIFKRATSILTIEKLAACHLIFTN